MMKDIIRETVIPIASAVIAIGILGGFVHMLIQTAVVSCGE